MLDRDNDDLRLIERAARDAGDIARKYYGGEYRRWSKSRGEPVTEADLAIDRFLHETLLDARCDYGWISEETGSKECSPAERIFVVDPIDGTTAFLKCKPHFSISIAVVEDSMPVAGVVFNPITNECFSAAKGSGSTLNGETIRVSACPAIEGCRMLGSKDLFGTAGRSILIARAWPDMQVETRNSVAYRMALVAAGFFDAALILSAKHDWDMAAGDLIVREAGGKVTAVDGARLKFGGQSLIQRSMVCAGGALHALLLKKLNPLDTGC